MEHDNENPDPKPSADLKPKRSVIDVLLLSVALGALIAITALAIEHYPTSADAASILGIVVPAFATIGAAVFGVTVAYSAGQAKGEAVGQQGEAAAAKTATQQTAASLLPHVEEALDAVDSMRATLQGAGTSLSGTRALHFAEFERADQQTANNVELRVVTLDPETLDSAHDKLHALRGAAQALIDQGTHTR